jgi:hypothetical protein
VAYLGGDRPPPRGFGRATATTSATFFPHCEQRHPGREFRWRHRPVTTTYCRSAHCGGGLVMTSFPMSNSGICCKLGHALCARQLRQGTPVDENCTQRDDQKG